MGRAWRELSRDAAAFRGLTGLEPRHIGGPSFLSLRAGLGEVRHRRYVVHRAYLTREPDQARLSLTSRGSGRACHHTGQPRQRKVHAMTTILALALAAAVYPQLLAIVIVILTRAEPRRLLWACYLGAAGVRAGCAVAILLLFRDRSGVVGSTSHRLGASVYLAAGAIALLIATVIASERGRALLGSGLDRIRPTRQTRRNPIKLGGSTEDARNPCGRERVHSRRRRGGRSPRCPGSVRPARSRAPGGEAAIRSWRRFSSWSLSLESSSR